MILFHYYLLFQNAFLLAVLNPLRLCGCHAKSAWIQNSCIFYYIPKIRGSKELLLPLLISHKQLCVFLNHISPSDFPLLVSR